MILIVLLAVGPFLHAHYGKSTVTGFHMAGVNAFSAGLAGTSGHPILPSFLPDEEGESAAVGVETSFARKLSIDAQDPPQTLLVLAELAFVVASQVVIASVVRWIDLPKVRTYFSAGFPPLTHAPPTFDC